MLDSNCTKNRNKSCDKYLVLENCSSDFNYNHQRFENLNPFALGLFNFFQKNPEIRKSYPELYSRLKSTLSCRKWNTCKNPKLCKRCAKKNLKRFDISTVQRVFEGSKRIYYGRISYPNFIGGKGMISENRKELLEIRSSFTRNWKNRKVNKNKDLRLVWFPEIQVNKDLTLHIHLHYLTNRRKFGEELNSYSDSRLKPDFPAYIGPTTNSSNQDLAGITTYNQNHGLPKIKVEDEYMFFLSLEILEALFRKRKLGKFLSNGAKKKLFKRFLKK